MVDQAPKLLAWSFPDADSLSNAAEQCMNDPCVKELLPIRTCQRFELFALMTVAKPMAFDEVTHSCDGSDAATRLFAIAAGAMSDVPGEEAVADQVRAQLRRALKCSQAGTTLAKLTRRALVSGEKLRNRVLETTPILELADLVVHLIRNFNDRKQHAARITLIGAGAVGRSIHNAMKRSGVTVDAWGTHHPRGDREGPSISIDKALHRLRASDILIVALGDRALPIQPHQLPPHVMSIDLSMPATVTNPTMNLRDVIERSCKLLQPQRSVVKQAAHRLQARAEVALAETLCPAMTAINESIARFRQAIIDAEYRRLAPTFEKMPWEEAERMRRSLRHTAARCVHPIHEYVNSLGRQGRVEEARTVVDHLLGTRVGLTAVGDDESRCGNQGIAMLGP